jgi:hypothetical protein
MRHEPTDAEAAMWRLLRHRQLSAFKFRRQVPFNTYILDFVCFEKRLVIEIDGGQHGESRRDAARDAALSPKALSSRATGTTTCSSDPLLYWRTSLQSSPSGKIPLTRRLTL